MNNPSISVKPEPPQAQSNWSYHAYFLKQRQLQAGGETPISMQTANSNESTVDKEHYQRVIAKMEELAASIDVHLTIIPSTLAVAASAS